MLGKERRSEYARRGRTEKRGKPDSWLAVAWSRRSRAIPFFVLAALLLGAFAVAGCGSHTGRHAKVSTRAKPEPPATPAGRQLDWFINHLNARKLPTTTEFAAHFAPSFLKALPLGKFVSFIEPVATEGPFVYGGSRPPSSPERLIARLDSATGASFLVTIGVTPAKPHRINTLLIQLAPPKRASWRSIDIALTKLADRSSMFAAEVRNGRLQTIHALHADQAGGIGSAFKLYVLDALGQVIESGKASWNQKLAIRSAWKSIPSGEMQNEPAGKRFSLLHYAQQMIAISDNTATDHLIRLLGRSAVEKAFVRLGNRSAKRNVPLLTTRELTVLTLDGPPAASSSTPPAAS
jgi:hypothetical protein